jgi:hypothetical protein
VAIVQLADILAEAVLADVVPGTGRLLAPRVAIFGLLRHRAAYVLQLVAPQVVVTAARWLL